MSRCVFCQSWTAPNGVNCGHGLDNGELAPNHWFARNWIPAYELGGRVMSAFNFENSRRADEYIERLGLEAARRAA